MWSRRAVGALAVLVTCTGPVQAQSGCDPATQYTYTFTNACPEPIWIGQRSTGDPASHPPQSGNWALSGRCATNADCRSGACDADSGRCTCSSATDCPGGAPCGADDTCSTSATFCMPREWTSGTFWPRTGCVLDAATAPATLTCVTGACFATDNSGRQLLDCSVANGGGSPTNPVTQLEVTSKSAAVNYDVSLAAGYNVETQATPVGGGQVVPGTPATDVVVCYDVGCTSDLNASCPAALRVLDGSTVIGCLDPCTRCQRPEPPPSLQCDTPLAETWICGAGSGPVTYLDLYCAKNTVDGSAQASPNQGTPTAFSQLDCPPVTTFVTPTFASGYALPAGQGVCLYTSPPQSLIQHFNDYGWADAASGAAKNCGGVPPTYDALPDGTPCGGYLTTQTGGGYYLDAIDYSCQTATYAVSGGGTQTAHLCMPPTTSGLGTCTTDTDGSTPLYSAGGGVANPAWLEAAKQAGGGTPYYVPFKTACQAAYAWQYDDIASGFGCTPTSAVTGGATFSGFHVRFCASRTTPGPSGPDGPPPDRVVALELRGRAAGLARPDRGRLRIAGRTTLPATLSLADATVTVTDLLDEVGAGGELLAGRPSLTPRKRRKKAAVFATDAGVKPQLKVVLRRPALHAERVDVRVDARRATIARPTCDDGAAVSLETALVIAVGPEETRTGTVGPWRCRRQALRAE